MDYHYLLNIAFVNGNGKYAIQLKKEKPQEYEDILDKFVETKLSEYKNFRKLFEFIEPLNNIPDLYQKIFEKINIVKSFSTIIPINFEIADVYRYDLLGDNVSHYLLDNYEDELNTNISTFLLTCVDNPAQKLKKCDLSDQNLKKLIDTFMIQERLDLAEIVLNRLSKRVDNFSNNRYIPRYFNMGLNPNYWGVAPIENPEKVMRNVKLLLKYLNVLKYSRRNGEDFIIYCINHSLIYHFTKENSRGVVPLMIEDDFEGCFMKIYDEININEKMNEFKHFIDVYLSFAMFLNLN